MNDCEASGVYILNNFEFDLKNNYSTDELLIKAIGMCSLTLFRKIMALSTNKIGFDCIIEAVKRNQLQMIKEILDKGVVETKIERNYQNPLFWAVFRRNVDIINFLLQKGFPKMKLTENEIKYYELPADFISLVSYE